jgi:hypothetical protein
MSKSFKYKEPYLEKRIEIAKAYARRIANGIVEDEIDLEMVYRMSLSEKYSIPFFSNYFDDKTIDQLAFEVFLIRERSTPVVETVSDEIKKQANTLADIVEKGFDDDDGKWDDVPEPSDQEMDRFKEFMKTGQFEPTGGSNDQ